MYDNYMGSTERPAEDETMLKVGDKVRKSDSRISLLVMMGGDESKLAAVGTVSEVNLLGQPGRVAVKYGPGFPSIEFAFDLVSA